METYHSVYHDEGFDPDKFIDLVFHEGTISALYGLPEDGKTNLAGVFMEMLAERGYFTYTVIHFFDYSRISIAIEKEKLPKLPGGGRYLKKPDEVKVVNTVSELLIGLLSTEPNVCIIDESGIFASSALGTSKRVRLLKELAYIIRHFGSSLLLISQNKKSVVPALREDLVTYEMRIRKMGVRKDSSRMLSVATGVRVVDEFTGDERVKFEVAEGDEYYGIPLTKYPIDSKYTPDFDIEDIDIIEARRRLRGLDSVAVRENDAGANIIRELKREDGTDSDQKEGEQLMTVAEFARKKRVTKPTVIRWCNKKLIRFILTASGRYRIYADQ